MKIQVKILGFFLAIISIFLIIFWEKLSPADPVVPFAYSRAAMSEFVNFCNESHIEYWKFGAPVITINPDSSRKFRWLFLKDVDSVEIIVNVSYQAELRFGEELKTSIDFNETPDGWHYLKLGTPRPKRDE